MPEKAIDRLSLSSDSSVVGLFLSTLFDRVSTRLRRHGRAAIGQGVPRRIGVSPLDLRDMKEVPEQLRSLSVAVNTQTAEFPQEVLS